MAQLLSLRIPRAFKSILPIVLLVSTVLAQSPSRVELRTFYSQSLGTNKKYKIYLPPGYDESGDRYPVVYFFRNHEDEWFAGNYTGREGTALKEVADGLLAAGLIGKMILVAPNSGSNNGSYVGATVNMLRPDLAPSPGIGNGRFEDYFVKDLIPMVDTTFRTVPDRAHRGMDGFSLGGYASTMLSMRHPEVFSSIGSFDGTIMWYNLHDPTTPGVDPNDDVWMPSWELLDPIFDDPRNVPYMLLHAASNILTSASLSGLDSIRSIRYHITCTYDRLVGNHDRNMQLLGVMRQYELRNSVGTGVLSLTGAHDYGYADLHATGSLMKHWQTFNGTAISAPGVVDFSITEPSSGNTSDVIVFNYGPGSIEISSISNSLPEFQLVNLPSLPKLLNGGDTVMFSVRFLPTANIAYEDTLKVVSNDSMTPIAKTILRGKGGSFRAKPATMYAGTAGAGLYSVDATSGVASLIGPYRRGWTNVKSIRVQPETKELVAVGPVNNNYYLLRVNAEGGDAFIGGDVITSEVVRSMAFYNDSTLYLVAQGGKLLLANIKNPFPQATVVGTMGTPMASICFHPTTKELWGIGARLPDRVYKIRLSPLIDTLLIGVTGRSGITTDIAFDARGNLYGLSGGQLTRIDTTSGSATVIGSLGINANSITINPDVTEHAITIVEKDPPSYQLDQNYPNPFNPTTNIAYRILNTENVVLKVFDIVGREVAVLVNAKKAPGRYEVEFDGSGLSSGVYFYQLTAGKFVETRKMILVR